MTTSPYLYGIHDPSDLQYKGWILFVHGLGRDPNDNGTMDYRPWSDRGYGIIGRLDHGYDGNGTIPEPSQYENFARRVGNHVRGSKGCNVWIIANEPNLSWERKNGVPIYPEMYARCYNLCRGEIHKIPGHEHDQVLIAPIGPWNIETGDWLIYFMDVLKFCDHVDGIALHTYTHGQGADLVDSDKTMDPPYGDRFYHFRAFENFMSAIEFVSRSDARIGNLFEDKDHWKYLTSVPVYITEANQNGYWDDREGGEWIQRAYKRINTWNKTPGNQTIRSLILFAWERSPYHIKGKGNVIRDFQAACSKEYTWTELGPDPIISPNLRILYMIEVGMGSIIDDWGYISARLVVGKFSHIGANCNILGGNELVQIGDFVDIAPGCQIASASEDYTNGGLSGPCIPSEFRGESTKAPVIIGDHCLLGFGTVVLPGVVLPEGVATGALTILRPGVKYQPWTIYVGNGEIPRGIKFRDKDSILKEKERFLKSLCLL